MPGWEVELDNGWWQRLDSKTEQLIAEAQVANKALVEYSVLVHDYIIDLKALEQVNQGTGVRRPIRCAEAGLHEYGSKKAPNFFELLFGCRCLKPAVDRDDVEHPMNRPDLIMTLPPPPGTSPGSSPGPVMRPKSLDFATSSKSLALLSKASQRSWHHPDPLFEEEVVMLSDEALSNRAKSIESAPKSPGEWWTSQLPSAGSSPGHTTNPLQRAVETFRMDIWGLPVPGRGELPANPQVVLNIYDLGQNPHIRTLNRCLQPFSAGAFHCGVEVYGLEWSFSDTEGGEGLGVFCSKPRCCEGHGFHESVPLGPTKLTHVEVWQILQMLMSSWVPAQYNVLSRNCCHFCEEFCTRLMVGPVPARIMRLAGVGADVKAACCCSAPSQELQLLQRSLEQLPSSARPMPSERRHLDAKSPVGETSPSKANTRWVAFGA